MSLYQFASCIDGWNKAQGAEEPIKPLTPEEYDADMLKAAARRARMH